MAGIKDRIISWAASELKYWEQAALNKIANGCDFREEDYLELVEYFEQDAGLVPPRARPVLSLQKGDVVEAKLAQCLLERIFNLTDVNALAVGQELRFGTQLTLIYGDNGAGKTGYARPLGCAGSARGKREVLPNAGSTKAQGQPRADIEVSYGGIKETIAWTPGDDSAALRRFYVFDGDSVSPHLTECNSLSFSPAGLLLLTRLADVTDGVRERIRQRISECEKPHTFLACFEGNSETKTFVASLDSHTKLEALERLAGLSNEETAKAADLEREIAELKLLDVAKQIEKRTQEINDIDNLLTSLAKVTQSLNEAVEGDIRRLIEKVTMQRREVSESGIHQFRHDSLTQIGSETWLQFLHAAKSLADAESVGAEKYPESDDPCLLCHQTLSPSATKLIRSLWAFLSSDPQAKLEAAELACREKIRGIEQVSLNVFASDAGIRRLLEEELDTIIPAIEAQIESCDVRRREFVESLRSFEMHAIAPLTTFDSTDLKTLINLRESEIAALSTSDAEARLTAAEAALRELQHRQKVYDQLEHMESYVEDRKWAGKARQAIGSTKSITEKYNQLFDELVTSRYRIKFEETLRQFKPDMQLTIETWGIKGETVRRIVLSPQNNARAYSLDRILSDGEKRAVAFSDFLTEASLDKLNNGIILDDPVTSLDDKWKGTLAKCLAGQARNRQVIIFTHDLSFLYQIKAYSNELGVDVVTHWIKQEDGQPGFVYLNNSPVCERDFRSAKLARDCYAESLGLQPFQQQKVLQQGFGALRTSYEALIIFEVFNEVVARFEERISFGRLSDVCVDQSLAQGIITRMEALSRYIDAHSHSDKFASVKPAPAQLLEEINAFESIRKKQQELKKIRQSSSKNPASAATPKPIQT